MRRASIEGLVWPGQARLAICVVIEQDSAKHAAQLPGTSRLVQRLRAMLREQQVPATWVGDDSLVETSDQPGIDLVPATMAAGSSNQSVVGLSGERPGIPAYQLQLDDDAQPYWCDDGARAILAIPLDPDCSDRQMLQPPWWTPDEWLQYAMDSFDRLHLEAQDTPQILGLHLSPQGSGRSGAIQALGQLLAYVQQRESVWIANAAEIAQHCQQQGVGPGVGHE